MLLVVISFRLPVVAVAGGRGSDGPVCLRPVAGPGGSHRPRRPWRGIFHNDDDDNHNGNYERDSIKPRGLQN